MSRMLRLIYLSLFGRLSVSSWRSTGAVFIIIVIIIFELSAAFLDLDSQRVLSGKISIGAEIEILRLIENEMWVKRGVHDISCNVL